MYGLREYNNNPAGLNNACIFIGFCYGQRLEGPGTQVLPVLLIKRIGDRFYNVPDLFIPQ
jgi:hypothetical protein